MLGRFFDRNLVPAASAYAGSGKGTCMRGYGYEHLLIRGDGAAHGFGLRLRGGEVIR